MPCLAEKSRMEICAFVSRFSEGKLGVKNDVLGMKSWSMITNRRGEKRRKSLRNQHKRLVAYQEGSKLYCGRRELQKVMDVDLQ